MEDRQGAMVEIEVSREVGNISQIISVLAVKLNSIQRDEGLIASRLVDVRRTKSSLVAVYELSEDCKVRTDLMELGDDE